MDEEFEKLLENPALDLMEAAAAARLARAGIKLGADWGFRPLRANPDGKFSPELLRRLAGG